MFDGLLKYFESLKNTKGHLGSIRFSVFVGLLAIAVRFGLHLPALPHLNVFLLTLVIFPLMIALINLGISYMCHIGWKAIGSKEGYVVAHACVARINLMIPVSIVLMYFFKPLVAVGINFIVGGIFYAVATVKTHSVPRRKAIVSIASVTVFQFAMFVLMRM